MDGSIINIWFEYSNGLEINVELLKLIEINNGKFTGKTNIQKFDKKRFFMREFNLTHKTKGIPNLVTDLKNNSDYIITFKGNNIFIENK